MGDLIFPNSFVRQYSGPLDKDLVFSTTAERNSYLTNARRYPGQIVYDVETKKVYVLNETASAWQDVFGATFTLTEHITAVTGTFSTSVSAPALSGAFFGDGSGLTDLYAKIKEVSATNIEVYPLSASHINSMLTIDNGSNNVIVTIKPEFQNIAKVGTQIVLLQIGTGTVTVSSVAEGVSIISSYNRNKIIGQNAAAALVKVSINSWFLGGDISA